MSSLVISEDTCGNFKRHYHFEFAFFAFANKLLAFATKPKLQTYQSKLQNILSKFDLISISSIVIETNL